MRKRNANSGPTSALWRRGLWAAAACALALIVWGAVAAQENHARDALWLIVHNQCVPDEMQHHDPAPCARVALGEGEEYAILKDIRGTSQYLLIATQPVSGIESPALLAPKAPNYFAEAWEARDLVAQALHKPLPREDLSLAINSVASRSQDQLHIHIDCVREDVRAAVREHAAEIGTTWAPFPVSFSRHHYEAMWRAGEELGSNNPFALLAQGVPGAAADMGARTLVVVGASRDGMPGFVLLEDEVNKLRGDLASGEELQDHACRVAADASAGSSH